MPRPNPGKMYALFPCPGSKVFPSKVTFGNGLPLTKMAFPWLHVYACSAVHSALDVGFERANITGRLLMDDIASMISFVNAPPAPVAPINAVGLNCWIVSKKLIPAWFFA